jgi:hypothetical protein
MTTETEARPPRKLVWQVLFIAAGGAAGFAYYYFVGCHTGTCPITSSPYISTAYGGLIGFFLGRR